MRVLAASFTALTLFGCTTTPATPDAYVETDAGLDAPVPPHDAGPPSDAWIAPPPVELGRHVVTVTDTRRIVPSDGIPSTITVNHSNNNLDVIRFGGRVFLIWRTAPNHYAGTLTEMHIVSSTDEVTWTDEFVYTTGTDIREPRFLVVGGSLFAYMALLGTDQLDFNPRGVVVSERAADGTWSTPEPLAGFTGYIEWRARTIGTTPYMLAYLGGEMIYDFTDTPMLQLDFLTTTDGRSWSPVDPAQRTVYTGGGSESDFAFADDGTLYAIIRNEAGDASGFGSLVCTAPAGDIANWSCANDPRKYDSPLVFTHDHEIYLIGRRNVTPTGAFDLHHDASFTRQSLDNSLDYWNHPKRCSLWRFVQGEQRIAFVLDLPSHGDTCFAAAIDGASSEQVVVYNYSSDVDGPDINWNVGQEGNTYVYRHVLEFAPNP